MTYKIILNNEVNVVEFVKKANRNNGNIGRPLYVLGYGSLLYTRGWIGRGMDSPVRKKDLKECRVSGFERGCYGLYMSSHFYGTVHKAVSHINGVVCKMNSIDDWVSLMHTEAIAGFRKVYNYRVVNITNNVSGITLPKHSIVHMVVNELRNAYMYKFHKAYPWYYQNVWDGVVRERSNDFINEFLLTGGIKK